MKKTILASLIFLGAALPAMAEAGEESPTAVLQKYSAAATIQAASETPATYASYRSSRRSKKHHQTASVQTGTASGMPIENFTSMNIGATSVESLVTQMAQAYGVPVNIAHAVVKTESGYNPRARNGVHVGLMQISTRTARGLGCSGNLYDPHANLDCGMRYLKQGIAKYGAGCGGVSSYNTGNYKTGYCTSYGRKVLALAGRIRVASAQ